MKRRRSSHRRSTQVGSATVRSCRDVRFPGKAPAWGLGLLAAAIGITLTLSALSSQPGPSMRLTGTVYECPGSSGSGCMARPAHSALIRFHQQGIFGRTYSAEAKDGSYLVDLPAGTFRVFLQGCTKYPTSDISPPMLVVTSERTLQHRILDWDISSDGSCSVGGPLMQPS